jgi:hypothetical protein
MAAKPKRYQLVVQFAGDYFATHAAMVAFEDNLIARLPARTCEVDGHDSGAGTMNFFVYTAFPVAAYQVIYRGTTRAMQRRMRIAYRAANGTKFTNLWPRRDPRPFEYSYEDGFDPFAPASKRAIPKRSPRGTRAK